MLDSIMFIAPYIIFLFTGYMIGRVHQIKKGRRKLARMHDQLNSIYKQLESIKRSCE